MESEQGLDIEAKLAAISFIAESALTVALLLKSPRVRAQLLSSITEASKRTEHLRAREERSAEWISTVSAKSHVEIMAILNRVADTVGAAIE